VVVTKGANAAGHHPARARGSPACAGADGRNAGDWDYWASEAATLMAGYLMLLTSLPVEAWPHLWVLASYRLRRQVELAPAIILGMIAA
jgi:hypothetical protein